MCALAQTLLVVVRPEAELAFGGSVPPKPDWLAVIVFVDKSVFTVSTKGKRLFAHSNLGSLFSN